MMEKSVCTCMCLGGIRAFNLFKKYKINTGQHIKYLYASWLKMWGYFPEDTAMKFKMFVSAGCANLGIWEG